jgi:hypothetical protein
MLSNSANYLRSVFLPVNNADSPFIMMEKTMTQNIDYTAWMNQPLIWGERTRGRGLVWTADSDWFINDPLGPKPHLHEEASEIVFLAQESMRIETSGTKLVYREGDFLLMPSDKYHNYWFVGDKPVCLFVVVAPNHKYNR